MFLSCSSLTTRLYSTTGITNKPQTPKSYEPELRAIIRTIRWVSDLKLNSMTLSVDSLNHLQMLSEEQNSACLQDACEKASVKIDHMYCSFFPSLLFNPKPEYELEKAWKRTGYLANLLGARVIEMLSPAMPTQGTGSQLVGEQYEFAWLNESFSWDKIWKKYVSSMRYLSRLAEEENINLAVEPRQREIVNGPNLLMRLLDEVDSAALGAIVDVSRLVISKEIPGLSVRKLGKRIYSVHLSDNDGVTEWHWAPGQGKIDWSSVFKALSLVGYDGILSLDVSGIDVEHEIIEGKRFVEGMLRSIQTVPRTSS